MNSYLKILACVTGALMVAITGANYLIDPYMMSGVLLPHGLNAIKPAFSDHHALGKPFVFAQRKPLAIVLGTSRENHGIDPDYDAWPAPAQQRFNLALDSASIGDLERLFEHATTAGAVRQVVIALDFLNMFDANMHGAINFDADLLQSERHSAARTRLNSLRYFASWVMLRDSVETLRNQDPQLIEFEATGRRNARVFDSAAHRFGQQHMFTFSETRYLRARANLPLQQRYSLTDKQGLPTLLPLARILDSAAAKRVDVRIYMTPVHARQLEIYRLLELWPALEDWKSAVARIAEGSYLRRSTSHFTVWDFS